MTNRGGRPPLPEGEQRDQRVRMQLTRREYAGLINACEAGESPGSAARRMLFYDDADTFSAGVQSLRIKLLAAIEGGANLEGLLNLLVDE